MSQDLHRRCIVLRGTCAQTAQDALACVDGLARKDVMWVSDERAPGEGLARTPANQVRQLLGQAFDAVVLDLHDRLDPDLIASCIGFVWGGGALLLRMPAVGIRPGRYGVALALYPFSEAQVAERFYQHFARALGRHASTEVVRLARAPHATYATREQDTVVRTLVDQLADEAPCLCVLTAGRGRGKSAALGRVLKALGQDGPRAVLCASHPDALTEVHRFAGRPLPTMDPMTLLSAPANEATLIVVDEAAQVPVPVLQALVRRHDQASFLFATTTHGYEGTGRGFVLRFIAWAAVQERPLHQLALHTPIRFPCDDPLEAFADDALLLHAEPDSQNEASARGQVGGVQPIDHLRLERDALVENESELRAFFGLLVHAHYRTVPSDLYRALDAPNLSLHATRTAHGIAAASLVAVEGGLPRATCEAMAKGETRIRGHALADTLVTHCGLPWAGELRMVRSIRIATHPDLRREGLASALVDHVHDAYPEADLFGTLFGATEGLIAFRRSVGYELVRVGVSRGSRTGEPAAVMVRPRTARAKALVDELRRALSHSLPRQLELLEQEGALLISDAMRASMTQGLLSVPTLDSAACEARARSYAAGVMPYEAVAFAVEPFVAAHAQRLDALSPTAARLLSARVLDGRPWREAAARAQLPHVGAAMRSLRPALRELLALIDERA